MGTKMAVAFANIFIAKIEHAILRQSNTTPIFWKRFVGHRDVDLPQVDFMNFRVEYVRTS